MSCRGLYSLRDQHVAGSSMAGGSTTRSVYLSVCAVECSKLVIEQLSLRDSLAVQSDLDGLPSSLLASHELCHFHQTNLCSSSLCSHGESADVFKMADFRLSHKVSGVRSSLQGNIISFC